MREIHCLFQIILEMISDLKQAAGCIYTFLSALFRSRAALAARGYGGDVGELGYEFMQGRDNKHWKEIYLRAPRTATS